MENNLPIMPKVPSKSKIKLPIYVWIMIVVGVLALLGGGLYRILSPKFQNALNKKISESLNQENKGAVSSPYRPSPMPLAHGKQTYTISGGVKGAPRISEATIDPIDPQKGASQTLLVTVMDGTGVKSVDVTVHTDNKSTDYKLSLFQGTATDGVWKGSWQLPDSYDYVYRVVIKARNNSGTLQLNTVTIR